MSPMRVVLVLFAAFGAAVYAPVAAAQKYPSRTITFVVPYPAGGLSDVIARATAQEMQKRLGASVVIENRVGGSGIVGAGYVARSAPDGYTLLVNAVADVTNLHYMPVPYSIESDFSQIGMIAEGPPLILIINPALPYRSVRELIDGARSGAKLNFGSSGPGTSPSIAISQLQSMASIDIVDVPYKGVAQAALGVMSGEIQAAFAFQGSAKPLAEEGKVRALASTGSRRDPSWPALPTMIESGFPGFEYEGFVGLAAPAKTPSDIISLLNRELNAAVNDEAFVRRFAPNGMRPRQQNSSADFAAYIKREIERNRELAKLTQQKPAP